MEQEAWPSPQTPTTREPLPRVEDLPVAEQGYEQESVKAAFDSFYRHAAQLDAALRTLEAVDSFHRHAASLRSDLRALRAAGWTQQSWTAPPTYAYGWRAPREGVSPAVWRIGGEVAFLVAAAVTVGVANLSWWAILLAMAGAFTIVCLIEWLAGQEPLSFARTAQPASPHPIVEAHPAEEADEQEALGWTAFEEAQEPSDAMTIIGVSPPDTEREPAAEAEPETEPEAEAELEPEPEEEEPDEPDLPPAAEVGVEPDGRRRWWRRRKAQAESQPESEQPRHVRVLPADDEADRADPWEQGLDEPVAAEAAEENEPDEETEDQVLAEEPVRRRFRRR
jgi:hypothetical protein